MLPTTCKSEKTFITKHDLLQNLQATWIPAEFSFRLLFSVRTCDSISELISSPNSFYFPFLLLFTFPMKDDLLFCNTIYVDLLKYSLSHLGFISIYLFFFK